MELCSAKRRQVSRNEHLLIVRAGRPCPTPVSAINTEEATAQNRVECFYYFKRMGDVFGWGNGGV